ncbi:MAG: dihydroxyacetone kinase subunit DhaL [Miniphocaeibacter sp.]|uniref:dihydroxyacetone kinase subunit DhaL n=1 Tax=Miniphocaeibacter sp. TaxID=3100973 RepID=UPI003BB0D2B4
MRVDINKEELKNMFIAVSEKIISSEDFLTEIDLKIGDGDHGTGMALGFKNVKEQLEILKPDYAEDVFKTIGTTMLDTMGGASGVLFGTVFISGILNRNPSEKLTVFDLSEIFTKSLKVLKNRGKAEVGDKTMVDAFEPAVKALEDSAIKGKDMKESLKEAAGKSKEGMEYTKTIQAKFGRAKSYGEKSIGLQDAGATSIWLIFQEMSDWADNNL